MNRNLFGRQDDEYLESDWYAVFERWIDDHGVANAEQLTPAEIAAITEGDCDLTASGNVGLEIIEWSSLPLSKYLCTADRVVDYIVECLSDDDITEGAWGALGRKASAIASDPDLLDAVNNALVVFGMVVDREVTYRLADKEVATHWVTFDSDGRPLYDGERMFPDRQAEHG